MAHKISFTNPDVEFECEPTQMCLAKRYPNGRVTGTCKSRVSPSGGGSGSRNTMSAVNWALQEITSTPRNPNREVTIQELEILFDGKHSEAGGVELYFSLPDDLMNYIAHRLNKDVGSLDTEFAEGVSIAKNTATKFHTMD